MKKVFEELKRRNVIKSALAYLVVAWVITQVITTVLPTFGAPDYLSRTIIFILIVGFPLWIIFSWIYEITSEGIKRTESIDPEHSITTKTSNRLNKIIIGALGIAILLLVYDITKGSSAVQDNTEYAINDKSVAVLAFADMSPNKDQEYFSDGISEEILNLLAKIPDLKVISRTSSFSFKGKDVTTEEIGESLKVAYVLEGSVRKSDSTLRITTQLINTSSGAHVWSQTYDHLMKDIFKIQDEIASQVTQQLKVSLLGEEDKSKVVNIEAYNLYLRAKYLMMDSSSSDNELAIQLLREAISMDDQFSLAWAQMSVGYFRSITNHGVRPMTFIDSISKMTEMAIKLDPKSADSYSTMAYYYYIKGEDKKALDYVKKALDIDANNSRSVNMYGLVLRDNGQIDQAIPQFEKVALLDPVIVEVYGYNLGHCYELIEMYPEAISYFNMALDQNENAISLIRLAEIAAVLGNKQESISFLERLLALNRSTLNLNAAGRISGIMGETELEYSYYNEVFSRDDFDKLTHVKTAIGIARIQLEEGKTNDAILLLDSVRSQIMDTYGENGSYYYETLWDLASIEALKGNDSKALDLVDEMINSGFLKVNVAQIDPNLKSIQNHPRFVKLMHNVKQNIEGMRAKLKK